MSPSNESLVRSKSFDQVTKSEPKPPPVNCLLLKVTPAAVPAVTSSASSSHTISSSPLEPRAGLNSPPPQTGAAWCRPSSSTVTRPRVRSATGRMRRVPPASRGCLPDAIPDRRCSASFPAVALTAWPPPTSRCSRSGVPSPAPPVHRGDPAPAGRAGSGGLPDACDGHLAGGTGRGHPPVVGELHAVPFEAGIPRVYTVLKLDERRDRPEQTLDDKVRFGRGATRLVGRRRRPRWPWPACSAPCSPAGRRPQLDCCGRRALGVVRVGSLPRCPRGRRLRPPGACPGPEPRPPGRWACRGPRCPYSRPPACGQAGELLASASSPCLSAP